MKVTGTGGPGSAGGPRATRPSGGGGFRLPSAGEGTAAAPASSVSRLTSVMGVDALLALQDVGGPLERRRKAVRRAGQILDVLDDIKVSLLGGDLSGADLERLGRAIREERGRTDDPKLEAVLDEVELRAAVELAKLEQSHRAA